MNFDGQYIYVVKEREFINTNENVYKIGSSMSGTANTPIGSNVYMIVKVYNVAEVEEEIVTQLKKCKSLIHYSCIGDEYFQGDIITIMNTVSQAIMLLSDKETDDSSDGSSEEEIACSDPIVLISNYIVDRKETLQGQSIDAMQFYKTVMSSVKLQNPFTYNKFTALLTKHRIYEQKMAYGPCFVFPSIVAVTPCIHSQELRHISPQSQLENI